MLVKTWKALVGSLFPRVAGAKTRRNVGRRVHASSVVEALECRVVPAQVISMQVDPPGVGPLDIDSLTYTVDFSVDVTGVDPSDFQIVTTGSVQSAAVVDVNPQSASTYKVTITGLSGSGEVRLDLIDDGTISETSFPLGPTFGPFDGSFQGQTFQLNGQYPFVIAIDRANPPTQTTDQTTLQWNVVFNRDVTGVDASDFFLTFNGSVTTSDPIQVSGGGSSYTITVTGITGTGDVRLSLADNGSVRALNGNPLMQASYSPGYTFNGNIVAGPQINSVQLADLNGDEVPDVVYGLPTTNQVGVVLVAPNFTGLGPATAFPAGGSPRAIVAEDVNGDGLIDVVVANQASISVLIGNGNGTFQAPVNISTPILTAVAVGDLNLDGFPEIVVTFEDSNSVAIFQNNAGTFSPAGTLSVGLSPSSVALGDVTGDGFVDIVVANRVSNTVTVLTRTGNGPFNALPAISTGTFPVSVDLHDLDNDGDLDIVTANEGSNDATVILSLGGSAFATGVAYLAGTQPSAIRIGDVNGDARPDLLVANQGSGNVGLLQGIGDGTFQPALSFATSLNPNAIALGDINRDGRVDFVTSTLNNGGSGGVFTHRNGQDGTFFGQTYTIISSGPIITSPNSATVAETDAASQFPLDVDAIDPGNASAVLTYLLSGQDQASFTIDSQTGQISFLAVPDYENPTDTDGDNVYLITVTVDNGLGETATQDITINVFAINEFSLTHNVPSSLSVNENTPSGTLIFDVDADDADEPPTSFGYSLLGVDAAFFAIDPDTGELTLVGSPDFENPQDQNGDNVYQIIVRIDGAIEDFVEVPVAVQVQPLNDNSPVITSPNSAVWDENTPTNIVVLDVNATDADLPAQTLTYSLAGADAGQFTINSATGEIRFANSPDFEAPADFNGDNVYNIRVTVSDGLGATANQNVTITVSPLDDNPPIYTSISAVSIIENFPVGTAVVDVNATDADLPAQPLSYFLGGVDASLFTIDSVTGEVRFVNSPDFEAPADQNGDNVYQLIVSTQSGNFSTGTQNITVTVLPVNDNTPQITSTDSAGFDENQPATDVVLDVDATDADLPAQTLNYALAGVDAAQFTINPATGEIRFVTSPDFEAPADSGADNVYNVTVIVNDGLGLSTQQDIAVTVFPVEDSPTVFLSPNAVSVNENTSTSSVVVDVEVQDDDLPPKPAVFFLSGPDFASFTIDQSTGEIRFVNSPDFEAPVDLDGNNVYLVRVIVSDGDVPYAFQDVAITVLPVNDNTPQITSPADFLVFENTPATEVAADIDATDADLPAQTLNHVLSGPDAALFSIDAATGEIRFLASPDFEVPTDQDGDGYYDVTVKVDDGLGLSVSQNVRIYVGNEFEPPTGVPASVTVLEDASITDFLQVGTMDSEGSIFFDIVTLPQHGTVTLDDLSGEYTYTPDPDYNGTDSFEYRVIQSESGGAPATISITIIPVNDAPSFIKGGNQNNLEDSGLHSIPGWATGIAAGPATATDESGQALAFNLTTDNDALFSVLPAVDAAGNLTYTLAPNANGIVNVTVALSDNGGTANGGVDTSAGQVFQITVTGINDPPVVNSSFAFNVRENAVAGQSVGTVVATDVDQGDTKQFAIISGNTGGTFAINATTGEITVVNAALLSVDPHPTFLMKVTVTDGANSSVTTDVTITVVDALVISFGGTIQTYVKTAGAIAIDPGTIARDALVPNINYNEGTLTVTINNPMSGDRLGILNRENGPGRVDILHGNIVFQSTLVIIGQIVSGLNTSGPLVIKLTSFADEAAIDALLQTISFRNTSSSNQTGTRSITFDLTNKAGDEHDIKTTQIVFASRSIPPTLTLPPGDVNYSNLATAIVVAPDALVADADSQHLNGGKLTVAISQVNSKKSKNKLSVLEVGGITLNGKDVIFEGHRIGRLSTGKNSLSVSFNSINATPAAVQALARAIAFSTTSGNTNLTDRLLRFTLSDGIGLQSATKTVRLA